MFKYQVCNRRMKMKHVCSFDILSSKCKLTDVISRKHGWKIVLDLHMVLCQCRHTNRTQNLEKRNSSPSDLAYQLPPDNFNTSRNSYK